MLTDTELRSRVIPAARQRVLQDFDNKQLVKELAEIYKKEGIMPVTSGMEHGAGGKGFQ
jgi:hypothetical protein